MGRKVAPELFERKKSKVLPAIGWASQFASLSEISSYCRSIYPSTLS